MQVQCETVAVLWIAIQEPFKRGGGGCGGVVYQVEQRIGRQISS
jgi:hypothetical protein